MAKKKTKKKAAVKKTAFVRYRNAAGKFAKAPTTKEAAKGIKRVAFGKDLKAIKETAARAVKPKPPTILQVEQEILGSSIPDFLNIRNKAKSYKVIDLQGNVFIFFSVENYLQKLEQINRQVGQIKKDLQEKGGLKETYLGWVTPDNVIQEDFKGNLLRFSVDYSKHPFKRVAADKWTEYKNKFFKK